MFNTLKDLFFPRICFSCNTKIQNGYICQKCFDKIDFITHPACRLCSKPLSDNSNQLCQKCFGQNPPYHRIISIASYKPPITELIHLFKYKNHDYLKELLASIMVSRLEKIGFEIKDYSMVTAVPTHLDKLKERGYNQASLLGKKLANHFKIPFTDDIIYGRKSRPAQVKLKKAQRQTGIKEAFQVKKQIKGENIIIVDDIVTTGSTITECALTLKKAGAKRITAITLAKTIL